LSDKEKYSIVEEELTRFEQIIRGHEKLLEAIGKL
jgi:hypothetical protein